MYFTFLALLLATRLALVRASVYVTSPVQSTTCTGGQSCLVNWVDNGESPLLSDIGECTVGIYSGEFTLVQSLPSVDVSTTSSFSFTPDPAAGPNGQYYLVFASDGSNYQGFSASFSLAGMSGTTPSGGSSAPVSTPTNSTSSSTPTNSTGSSTPSTPTGSVTPSTTPTTTGSSVPPPSGLTTPTASATKSSVPPTTSKTSTTSSTSPSASATPTGAAVRIGTSTSLVGVVALFVLSGVLAF